MAQLTVKINGYAYTVACEDGQEAHLQEMARQIEQRIESVKALGGSTGEGRALVLAALLMADELHDTGIELADLRRQLAGGAPAPGSLPAKPPGELDDKNDQRTNKRINKLAAKAEDIAARLEQP